MGDDELILARVLADHQRDLFFAAQHEALVAQEGLQGVGALHRLAVPLEAAEPGFPRGELLQPRVGREQRHQATDAHQPARPAEAAEERLRAGQPAQQVGH